MLKVRVGPRYARFFWDVAPLTFDFSRIFAVYVGILNERGIPNCRMVSAYGGESDGGMTLGRGYVLSGTE